MIKFAQIHEDTPTILLLDEPGLSLHGKAQGDLLRYFDKELAPHHQIIYSTHSPFMVAPDKLLSARIVEDVVYSSDRGRPKTDGTKVREDVLNRDPDTIFPLQGALGYEITQTLFVGKHCLLVEGPSDILYLKSLSAALAKRKRTALDPRWTLCPSGGIGKIMPFVTLFKGTDINIGVFTDYVKGDKKKVEDLRTMEVLKKGAVLTAAEFTGKDEADTEDLFEPELFVNLVNEAYSLQGQDTLTTEKLDKADESTPRQVKKVEAYFKLLPGTIPMFDHYTPSQWLIENPNALAGKDPGVEKTLERVQALFETLNKLLP
ncbi:MAG: ATP-dependent nuclease [Woeseiaceae bacterium]